MHKTKPTRRDEVLLSDNTTHDSQTTHYDNCNITKRLINHHLQNPELPESF